MYGRRAAFFAAALFALLGPTLHLGVFATCDGLSVLLVALAAWCGLRATGPGDATGWMVTAGAALALANAAASSVLTAVPHGGRIAARRAAIVLAALVGADLPSAAACR